jgi:23S rRNA maturation-related 3'-5' exoribonuclease YhaM
VIVLPTILKKNVTINGKNYDLEIAKVSSLFGVGEDYIASLKDPSNGLSKNKRFLSENELADKLQNWIISVDKENRNINNVINQLKEWDGVIEYDVHES